MSTSSEHGLAFADSEIAVLARVGIGNDWQFNPGGLIYHRLDTHTIEIMTGARPARPSRALDRLRVEFKP